MHFERKTAKLFVVKPAIRKPSKQAFTSRFAKRLKDAREDTIYERADIARACGVTKDTVRQWEDGRAVMPAAYWVTVCEMLYIDPWQLLTGRRRADLPDLPPHLRNPNREDSAGFSRA